MHDRMAPRKQSALDDERVTFPHATLELDVCLSSRYRARLSTFIRSRRNTLTPPHDQPELAACPFRETILVTRGRFRRLDAEPARRPRVPGAER